MPGGFGIDVVIGVLLFITALLTRDANTKALCYRALKLFAIVLVAFKP